MLQYHWKYVDSVGILKMIHVFVNDNVLERMYFHKYYKRLKYV